MISNSDSATSSTKNSGPQQASQTDTNQSTSSVSNEQDHPSVLTRAHPHSNWDSKTYWDQMETMGQKDESQKIPSPLHSSTTSGLTKEAKTKSAAEEDQTKSSSNDSIQQLWRSSSRESSNNTQQEVCII